MWGDVGRCGEMRGEMVATSSTNQRRCHALVVMACLLLSLFLKSQPALRVCFERSTTALASASTGAWLGLGLG